MRATGGVLVTVGIVAMLVLFLLPVRLQVLGVEFDCGAPIQWVIGDDQHPGLQEAVLHCESESNTRVGLGAIIAVVLGSAGIIMISFGASPRSRRSVAPVTSPTSPPPGWYVDPTAPGATRWWDGTRWSEHVQPPS